MHQYSILLQILDNWLIDADVGDGVTVVPWLLPVKDHPKLAKCRWCNLITSKSYLFQHAKSAKHVRNAARFLAGADWEQNSLLDSSSIVDGKYN